MNLIDALTTDRDPWAMLEQIANAPPESILDLVREQYKQAEAEQKLRLIWLVERLKVSGAEQVLIDWLCCERAENATKLLLAINSRGAVVPSRELLRLLSAENCEPSVMEAAIEAAGLTGDASLAPVIASKLDDSRLNVHAAIALGRLRATPFTGEIVSRLPSLQGRAYSGFLVALELMNDRSAIAPLRDWLIKAPFNMRWSVHSALVRLTACEPVLPLNATPDSLATAVADAWEDFDDSTVLCPRIEQFELKDLAEVHFTLHDSGGAIRIDYDLSPARSSWPRWSKSLWIGSQRIYDVGSDCGTCETSLQLVGWSKELATLRAQEVRTALEDVRGLSRELLDTLLPLIRELRPGHYIAALVDLDLERVSDPTYSWWFRRRQNRYDDMSQVNLDLRIDWPGTEHFQLKSPIAVNESTFCAVLPSQDLSTLVSSCSAGHEDAIRRGQRPAAVSLAWLEARDVGGEYHERFLLGVVLDGHHKLVAYAQQHVPARTLLICRIEDTWGPDDNRALWFLESIVPLKAPAAPYNSGS